MTLAPTVATEIIHDVSLEALEDDPYPVYKWMRRHRPIAYVPETGRVWITTWGLCAEAGNNDEVFGPTRDVFHAVYGDPNVMSLSGPDHLAHRAALNPRYRPRAVGQIRDSILRATAARYIDQVRDRGRGRRQRRHPGAHQPAGHRRRVRVPRRGRRHPGPLVPHLFRVSG